MQRGSEVVNNESTNDKIPSQLHIRKLSSLREQAIKDGPTIIDPTLDTNIDGNKRKVQISVADPMPEGIQNMSFLTDKEMVIPQLLSKEERAAFLAQIDISSEEQESENIDDGTESKHIDALIESELLVPE